MIITICVIVIAAVAFFFVVLHLLSYASNSKLPTKQLSLDNATWTVELATTMMQQSLGLSGRDGLGNNDGMLFVFNGPGVQNFWMKDMKFPLDIIWISKNTVAGFVQSAEPQPGFAFWNLKIYTSPYGVDKVLEVNAGTVAQYGIKVGDTINLFQ